MFIKANTPILVFRFSSCWTENFIEAHKTVIESQGRVWVYKQGKKPSADIVNKIIAAGGYIIFKEPKNLGDRYYFGTIDSVRFKKPDDPASNFPQYYSEKLEIGLFENGTWFLVRSIEPFNSKYIEKLFMIRNGKKLIDQINRTSSAIMYVYCDTDMQL